MAKMKKVLKQFKDACKVAIENDEMAAPDPYTPPTPQEVAAAEGALDISFPKDFLQFHAECEGYRFPFWELFTLTGKSKSSDHIIGANLSQRRKPPKGISLPDHLIAFHDDGSLNLHCFDVTEGDSSGNCAIVCWEHDSPDADPNDLDVFANTFTEWLEEQIEDAEVDFDN